MIPSTSLSHLFHQVTATWVRTIRRSPQEHGSAPSSLVANGPIYPSRFQRHLKSGVVIPLLGSLVLAAPAKSGGGWTHNPQVALSQWDPSYVLVPVGGTVGAIQAVGGVNGGIKMQSLNVIGDDPTYYPVGPPEFFWPAAYIYDFAACSLGEDDFAFAYTTGADIYVVMEHYDAGAPPLTPPYFTRTVGPVSVGLGWDIAMTPRWVPGAPPSIDGVCLAWRNSCGATLNYVLQQGVHGPGPHAGDLVWNPVPQVCNPQQPNGVVVTSSLSFNDSLSGPPNIVGSADGLAIVTYQDSNLTQGNFYHTTKLANNGINTIWTLPVPGQVTTFSPLHECLVARDGTGGAFYCCSIDYYDVGSVLRTRLIMAQVMVDGDQNVIQNVNVFYPNPSNPPISATSSLRPLAVVATPDGGVMAEVRYEDIPHLGNNVVDAIKFIGGTNVPEIGGCWLYNGTYDNSESASGVYAAFGANGRVGFATTLPEFGELRFSEVDAATGEGLYGGGGHPIVQVIVTAGDHAPSQPKIGATSWCAPGFILGWNDIITVNQNETPPAVYAERVSNGALGLPPGNHCLPPWGFCYGDSTGAPCPCLNTGALGHGCDNSLSTGGALLAATGVASLTADTLLFTATGELPTALSIFLQGGVDLSTSVSFGDGLRCVGGSLKRLYNKNASAGVVSAPTGGDLPVSMRSAALGDTIVAGQTRSYQVYYRDPNLSFCPSPVGSSFNVSQAVKVYWVP